MAEAAYKSTRHHIFVLFKKYTPLHREYTANMRISLFLRAFKSRNAWCILALKNYCNYFSLVSDSYHASISSSTTLSCVVSKSTSL